ncbi:MULTISPECIES: hypothetical protein [Priestia]|jgi:hypothetical protein|uniref:DNA alkylation repair protein n=3 Tax=Priestia TaxID=2800373 RepID=A0A0H4KFV1_9BACI|nr:MULTISPECIES: hypothetical protein [Priestia]AKO91661.1 DNA alkylation repair protein [Priestia filamentosa]KAB2496073.1 DNA alkylation repair protein [Priestia endophytica]KYG31541.1 DNA alkylation repair protein [Priestia endophytica]MBG9811592.1 DNA alkylation repair protein [Priestia endophytica]MCM3536985.1 DNA alkylation repair protein [Priestia endophytica]
MTNPYLCPSCKTNRTRFNLISQVAQSVKMDPQSGEITNEYDDSNRDAFHLAYKGPERKVQCGTCGLVEEEQTFINHAKLNR